MKFVKKSYGHDLHNHGDDGKHGHAHDHKHHHEQKILSVNEKELAVGRRQLLNNKLILYNKILNL